MATKIAKLLALACIGALINICSSDIYEPSANVIDWLKDIDRRTKSFRYISDFTDLCQREDNSLSLIVDQLDKYHETEKNKVREFAIQMEKSLTRTVIDCNKKLQAAGKSSVRKVISCKLQSKESSDSKTIRFDETECAIPPIWAQVPVVSDLARFGWLLKNHFKNMEAENVIQGSYATV